MTATMSPADRLRALAAEQLQRDAWSRDELLAHQRRRLDDLLAHAAASGATARVRARVAGVLEEAGAVAPPLESGRWPALVREAGPAAKLKLTSPGRAGSPSKKPTRPDAVDPRRRTATRGIANNTPIGFTLVRRRASTARPPRSGRPFLTDS